VPSSNEYHFLFPGDCNLTNTNFRIKATNDGKTKSKRDNIVTWATRFRFMDSNEQAHRQNNQFPTRFIAVAVTRPPISFRFNWVWISQAHVRYVFACLFVCWFTARHGVAFERVYTHTPSFVWGDYWVVVLGETIIWIEWWIELYSGCPEQTGFWSSFLGLVFSLATMFCFT